MVNPDAPDPAEDEPPNKRIFSICGIIGTALVWSAVWALVDLAFRGMPKAYQIMGHLAVLMVGIKILHLVGVVE